MVSRLLETAVFTPELPDILGTRTRSHALTHTRTPAAKMEAQVRDVPGGGVGGTRAGRTQGKVVLCSCGCNPEREGLVQGLSGPTRAQGLGSRCSQHPHPLPDSWLTSPAVPWASAPLQAGLGPLQPGAWWQVGVGGSSATVPSQGPHPRGWPQCARGAPAPGQVGFPPTEHPPRPATAGAVPHPTT